MRRNRSYVLYEVMYYIDKLNYVDRRIIAKDKTRKNQNKYKIRNVILQQ